MRQTQKDWLAWTRSNIYLSLLSKSHYPEYLQYHSHKYTVQNKMEHSWVKSYFILKEDRREKSTIHRNQKETTETKRLSRKSGL